MFEISDALRQQLLAASLGARQHSHSPYSKYAVGAAVLDEQGRIHVGANIENAAYPQGWCAETTALGAMLMAGGRSVKAVLVTGPGPDIITPCGGCRQKLREFGGPDLFIIAGDPRGIQQQWTLDDLLPFSFGPEHLKL
ncbi:cytidine deaminase [Roseateles microcysteis]|uniref:cytidine deaminase n=1 Tax=Roseateles microcysteis TaxID=3119057 RepID=UPI002FE5E0D6